MRIGDICTRSVVTCARDTPLRDAARLMLERHVGDLVVVDERDGRLLPAGIVTDRDLALRVLANGVDADAPVADVMQADLVTATPGEELFDAIWYMRSRGVRRLPVVDAHGHLLGLLTAEQVVRCLAEEMTALGRIGPRASQAEGHRTVVPVFAGIERRRA